MQDPWGLYLRQEQLLKGGLDYETEGSVGTEGKSLLNSEETRCGEVSWVGILEDRVETGQEDPLTCNYLFYTVIKSSYSYVIT